MYRVGVDEAGKGPVLGSMFAGAVAADPETLPDDVADSKTLAQSVRRRIDDTLRSKPEFDVAVAEIPVDRIDDPGTNMIDLTATAHADALTRLDVDLTGLQILSDGADTDADRFARRVESRLNADVALEARHGADADNQLVGAASVVAKVARETHVECLEAEYGQIGSGYPADPRTRSFLADYVGEHGTLPACARESWATSADLRAAVEQHELSEF